MLLAMLPTVALSQAGVLSADVAFMRGMIAHHAQAIEMTRLVPDRTARPDLLTLARRIDASQQTETVQMQSWLRKRGLPFTDSTSLHHEHMPGMLSEADLAALRAARGPNFERLFLELMIRHHEGALSMLRALQATPGAGEEAELFMLGSSIDADQRAEIARMRTMLSAISREK